jgi:hypothetical protein
MLKGESSVVAKQRPTALTRTYTATEKHTSISPRLEFILAPAALILSRIFLACGYHHDFLHEAAPMYIQLTQNPHNDEDLVDFEGCITEALECKASASARLKRANHQSES